MRAMIMAAGVGSRLMPLTVDVPKPMVPMANRPLMENTIRLLKAHGCDEIIANLHYHGPAIKEYFHTGKEFGVNLHYSEEKELMGTAGGVRRCEWFLQDTFVVMSGDALTDIDLTELVAVHKQKGALATIALKKVEDVENYGVVITDGEGCIRAFQEKPRREEALSQVVNTGIYVFEPEIFKFIPAGKFYDFGKQVFPHLVEIGAPFFGHIVDRYWCDVGDLDTYRAAHASVLAGEVSYHFGGQMVNGSLGTHILLGEGAEFGRGVKLKGCVVIGPHCRIEDGAVIEDSVIWGNTVLKAKSIVRSATIGQDCLIGRSALVSPGSVVGSGCTLEGGTVISAGARVFRPGTEAVG